MEAQLVAAPPSTLNGLIETGQLEVSSVSAFCYIKSDDLELLPDLSISSSSTGPVGSVLLFLATDPGNLDGKRVEVPLSSATSVNLLRVLLREQYSVTPEIVPVETPSFADEKTCAALVIGDRALQVDSDWSGTKERIDMGEWWLRRYSLPMVFGVWAARREFKEQNQDSYRHIRDSLVEARDMGINSMLSEVVKEASARAGIGEDRLKTYFTEEIDYELRPHHRESIELYQELLSRYSLV